MTQTVIPNSPPVKFSSHSFKLGAFAISLIVHAGVFIHFAQEPQTIRLGKESAAKNVLIRILPAKDIVIPAPAKLSSIAKKKATQKVEPKPQSLVEEKINDTNIAGEQTLLASYLEQVRLAVEEQKFYPSSARRMRQEGVVEATFTLNRSGKLTELISIEGPYQALNEAVRELLNAKAIFPAMPVDLKQEDVRITLPISFELI